MDLCNVDPIIYIIWGALSLPLITGYSIQLCLFASTQTMSLQAEHVSCLAHVLSMTYYQDHGFSDAKRYTGLV